MKLLPLLLAASLVANAAFVTTRAMRTSAAQTKDDRRTQSSAPASTRTSTGGQPDSAIVRTDIIAALKTNNIEALRDLLRDADLPDEIVRSIVSSVIWSRYREQIHAMQPKPDPNKPWWKNEQNDWYTNTSREQRAEMRRIQRESENEMLRLLGPNKDNSGWGPQDTRLSFLPESKRKAFQDIDQDYQDLIQEAQQEMQGFRLPSDAEKIRFLQEEQKRDLAAILTPAELADYELRMSPTAQQLRWKMTRFDGTEDEYRKIFALQKTFDSTQQTDAWGNLINQGPDDWKKRQEGEKQLAAQIKEALGPERYAEYARSQNNEYQQLTAAAKRFALPPETAIQVYNLRNDVSAESQRIVDNGSLGPDQKKQALADLAKKTREQVRTSLGVEAADAYLKYGMNWLNNVEQGNAITFSEDGRQNGTRPIPREPKKPAPNPKQ
jgi:hypothetical protein